ncbi:mannosyltransferase putative-domain-containing protein [Chytriomyces sp. MP71]|nr:mannosyltransferase putative-domain-containing protein [Chytriomyces sp. MP71]
MQHLILSLRILHNVSIPIQVFYAGKQDLIYDEIRILESLPNVSTHNVLDYFPAETRRWESWSIKPYAMLASRFRRIVFLDADVVLFQDPIAAVQRHPIFQRTGQLFFRDRHVREERFLGGVELFHQMNRYPSQYSRGLGYTGAMEDGTSETHEMDSGFIAMDKGNFGVLMGLLLAAKMNAKIERDGVLYAKTYGDKESFWFASEVLRVPYGFNHAFGGVIGEKGDESQSKVCGISLLQLDSDMRPLHLNGGFLRERHVSPEKAQFIPFERIGLDLNGHVTWSTGHCLHGGAEGDVRSLNAKEKATLAILRGLFMKNLTVIPTTSG